MRANRRTFRTIYWLALLWAFAFGLPLYIQSSFLTQFVSVQTVGLLTSISTGGTLILIVFFPRFIQRFSNYRVMGWLLGFTVAAVLLLVALHQHPVSVVFYIMQVIALSLLAVNLDIFLEDISDNAHTGEIRTRYLTVLHVAWILSPLASGVLLGSGSRYWLVYLVAALFLVAALVLLRRRREYLHDAVHYRSRPLITALKVLRANRNLSIILTGVLAIEVFYAVMVLYTPLYLHQTVGFSWSAIGVIFFVMLLPFILFEIPAGKLADSTFGEKEFLLGGLALMIISTGALFFIHSTSIVLWAGFLFATRIGAALVESMQETYFFKTVNREDSDLITVFRDLRPAGWLVGSLLAVAVLSVASLASLFLVVAVILVASFIRMLTLDDTR